MNNPTSSWTPEQAKALEFAWGEYRAWAATSRQKKAEIFSWKFWVLVLTVVGALLATVSKQIAGFSDPAAWAIGIVGGGLVALATYFGREILSPEQERIWIRARSMAEALKSEIFLFRAGATPYEGPEPGDKLMEQVRKHLGAETNIQPVTLTAEEQRKDIPEGSLSVEEYIKERVDNQIDDFYRPRIQQYDQLMKHWRNVNLSLGAVATVLGVLGKWTGAWVAVITTITTSVAAYLYANRYQYLIISYQATARQLKDLKYDWIVMGAPEQDAEKRNKFLKDCEEAISIENSAWMAKLTEKPKS